MDILVLISSSGCGARSLYELSECAPAGAISCYANVSAFLSRLREANRIPALIILFIGDEAVLRALERERELLSGYHIVVALHEMNEDWVALAHRLQPRLVIACDEAEGKLGAVVGKMLRNHGQIKNNA